MDDEGRIYVELSPELKAKLNNRLQPAADPPPVPVTRSVAQSARAAVPQ